jgi:hypothetical protein
MLWHTAGRAWPSALVTSIVVFLEVQVKLLGEHSSPLRLLLSTAGLFVALALLESVREVITARHYEALTTLADLVASHEDGPEPGLAATTLYDFVDNWEDPVGKGGHVRILTRNVDAYDSLPTALHVIAENLTQGATYTYLLPKGRALEERFGRYLRTLNHELVGNLNMTFASARELIHHQVRLFRVSVPVFTSFGLVSTGNDGDDSESGFWYEARPKLADDGASTVSFARLDEAGRERLADLLATIERRSRRIDSTSLLDTTRVGE